MLSNRIIECQINISVKVYKKRNIGIDSEADTNRNIRLFRSNFKLNYISVFLVIILS